MARPRKYIQVNGKTIDGVHHHRASGRYYVLDHQGRQVYFRDWREASETYQSYLVEQLEPVDRAKLEARANVRMARTMQLLHENGEGSRADDMLFETVAERILRNGTSAWLQFLEQMNGTADELGVPSYDVVEIGQPTTAVQAGESNVVDNPRLSKVGEAWLRARRNEQGRDDDAPKSRTGSKRCSGVTRHLRPSQA